MDIHAFIHATFVLMAFVLPLLIVPKHMDGPKLGLGLAAGLMATVSSWSMMNRLSGFLDTHIPDTQICWLDKPEIVALMVLGCAVFSFAVFVWVIPATKLCAMGLFPSLSEDQRKHSEESVSFFAQPEHAASKWAKAIYRFMANLLGSVAGLAVITAYLVWPSAVLKIDINKHDEDRRAIAEAAEYANKEKTYAKRLAISVAEQGNELLRTFKYRSYDCTLRRSACKEIYNSHKERLSDAVRPYGIQFSGDSINLDEAAKKLTDVEMIKALSEKLQAIAARNNIKLTATKSSAQGKAEKPNLISEDDKSEKLAGNVIKMFSDPIKFVAPLTADMATAMSLGLETIAILLCFFASSRQRQDDAQPE